MSLSHINNGDSGLSARTTINSMIDEVNSLYLPSAASSAPALTDTVEGITSGTTYKQFSLNQIGAALSLQPAGGNLSFFVATTGSDSNTGTSGSPFLTLQHAVNVCATFNYQGQFSPTINVADGTYNGVQGTLPFLYGLNTLTGGATLVGNITTPANCKLNDTGTFYTINAVAHSNWNVGGFNFGGTYGGISIQPLGTVSIAAPMAYSGTLTHGCYNSSGFLNAFASTHTITSTSIGTLLSTGFIANWDNASIVFSNAVTFTAPIIALDDTYGFLGFDGATFTNPTNVTMTGGVPCLLMTNGSYFEHNGALSRTNFPGSAAGMSIDNTSIFQPDGGYTLQGNGSLGWQNGSPGTALDSVLWRPLPGTIVLGAAVGLTTGGTLGAASILGTAASGGVGYANLGLGVGGSFAQATSKTTTVSMSTPTGVIQMATGALLGGAKVSFTVTNANIAAVDVPHVCISSGGTANAYRASVTAVAAGSCAITVENITAGPLTEQPVISFALIKGATT